MADYYTQSVVQQILPFACMTSLEKLVLSAIFETEEIDGGLYCFSSNGINDTPAFNLAEVGDALKHAEGIPSRLHDLVKEQAKSLDPDAASLELDLSVAGYEFILQDILRRSESLSYISIVSAFTCSKMRPDGFGGMVTLITRSEILSLSTNTILEKWLIARPP